MNELDPSVEVDSTLAPEVTATTDTASIEPEITENSQEQVPEEKKFTQEIGRASCRERV